MNDSVGPNLAVIVPVHDAASTIEPCLQAIRDALGPNDEVVVVDDASTDTGIPHQEPPIRCVVLDTNVGRGPARNIGASMSTGDVLVFVDADVLVHRDALESIRIAFREVPERSSLIGAYDDRPGAAGIISQYRNLLHHRTHHTNGPTSVHFWTGVGAVRREVFEAVGGLDETNWARDMEDVEFGHRLGASGFTIDVIPHIQGTHLKRFTLRSMVTTDLVHRAVPWSTLMLRSGFRRNAFVLSGRQILSVAAVFGTLVTIVATIGGWVPPLALVLAPATFVVVNIPLWRFFVAKRGWAFAAAAIPLHALHSLTSGTGFLLAMAGHAARSTTDRTRTTRGEIPRPETDREHR